MTHHITSTTDADLGTALRNWFEAWHADVQAVDFEHARRLFHDDVLGFGTHMHIVSGLEHLEQQQWRSVWPSIQGFTFTTDEMHCGASGDGLQAWALVPWTSTGFHADGSEFDRPGRATVLFRRETLNDGWRAFHTHISLAPGTPQRSHGRTAAGTSAH